MENNTEDSSGNIDSSAKNRQEKVPEGMSIVGYNILVLVIYTILCKLNNDVGGLLIDAFLIGLHVITCVVIAIIKKSGTWLLAGVLVLIIGFSTCIYIGNVKI